MTTEKKPVQEFLANSFLCKLECRYDTGPVMGRFFSELRDHKKIWGIRCPSCGRVYAPPPSYCYLCHGVECTEWVEQDDEGKLTDFSVVYFPFINPLTGVAEKVPWCFGIIELDGGALITHRIIPPNPEKLKIGDRYKAVWSEGGRMGWFWDILCFTKK